MKRYVNSHKKLAMSTYANERGLVSLNKLFETIDKSCNEQVVQSRMLGTWAVRWSDQKDSASHSPADPVFGFKSFPNPAYEDNHGQPKSGYKSFPNPAFEDNHEQGSAVELFKNSKDNVYGPDWEDIVASSVSSEEGYSDNDDDGTETTEATEATEAREAMEATEALRSQHAIVGCSASY